MKKILLVFTLAITFIFLVSCNSNDTGNNGKNSSESSADFSETSAEPSSKGEIPEGKITEEMVRNHKVSPESDFEVRETMDGVRIRSYLGNDDIVVIPEKIDGQTVEGIQRFVFANKSTVRGVYIPQTVKSLNHTFINSDYIEVVICEGVEVLEGFVFAGSNHYTQLFWATI